VLLEDGGFEVLQSGDFLSPYDDLGLSQLGDSEQPIMIYDYPNRPFGGRLVCTASYIGFITNT